MENYPNSQENVGENSGAEMLAEMPPFKEHDAIKDNQKSIGDKYNAGTFVLAIYEGDSVFYRDYDFDDDLYTKTVSVAPGYRVERPAVEKTAIRYVADNIVKEASPENDDYAERTKNVTKLDILFSLFEGQSLEKQTSDTLIHLSDKVDDILKNEDLRDAKIDISNTGVLPLVCISEVRNSMREAYEKLQNV